MAGLDSCLRIRNARGRFCALSADGPACATASGFRRDERLHDNRFDSDVGRAENAAGSSGDRGRTWSRSQTIGTPGP